jgi:hypothetical protein
MCVAEAPSFGLHENQHPSIVSTLRKRKPDPAQRCSGNAEGSRRPVFLGGALGDFLSGGRSLIHPNDAPQAGGNLCRDQCPEGESISKLDALSSLNTIENVNHAGQWGQSAIRDGFGGPPPRKAFRKLESFDALPSDAALNLADRSLFHPTVDPAP